MTTVRFVCACGKRLRAPGPGIRVECPRCGVEQTVPEPSVEPAPVTPLETPTRPVADRAPGRVGMGMEFGLCIVLGGACLLGTWWDSSSGGDTGVLLAVAVFLVVVGNWLLGRGR